jgi:hypothetical protein
MNQVGLIFKKWQVMIHKKARDIKTLGKNKRRMGLQWNEKKAGRKKSS